jgi:hypothetical protein
MSGGRPEKIIVPAALGLNGNTVTLSKRWTDALAGGDASCLGKLSARETARRFARVLRRSPKKPHLAVVHTFSTHNLLLRYWLATAGIDPDHDVTFTVASPRPSRRWLPRSTGFAPVRRGRVAACAGLSRAVATSHAIWNSTERSLRCRRSSSNLRPAAGALRCAAALYAGRRMLGLPKCCRRTGISACQQSHSDVAARRGRAARGIARQRRCLGVFANAPISRGGRMPMVCG